MTEQRPAYHVGDPGDETTPRLGYTADEVEEVALGEYRLKPGVAATSAVGMAPTQAEMAQAIREYADSTKALTGQRWWWDTGNPTHYRRRLAERAIEELAARLPRGR